MPTRRFPQVGCGPVVAAAPAHDPDVLLKAVSVSKSYGGVTVLDQVDVEFRSGEVHALLCENGAARARW